MRRLHNAIRYLSGIGHFGGAGARRKSSARSGGSKSSWCCRFEELESRELLSVAPVPIVGNWNTDAYDDIGVSAVISDSERWW